MYASAFGLHGHVCLVVLHSFYCVVSKKVSKFEDFPSIESVAILVGTPITVAAGCPEP